MGRFLTGEPVSFDISLLALDRCSDFQRRVLLAERDIPRGWVSTYGRIASHLGIQGGARAVGNALARNPFPILIPCHRAIRADGRLGGFQGGMAMKRSLLMLEGVSVSEDGLVTTDQMFY
jgi:methylated-DNA-[protein]-cysteine S-methyltransferase